MTTTPTTTRRVPFPTHDPWHAARDAAGDAGDAARDHLIS